MLNKGKTGTILTTSLVWRGPWLEIEPGTSCTRSQAIEGLSLNSLDFVFFHFFIFSFLWQYVCVHWRVIIEYLWNQTVALKGPFSSHKIVHFATGCSIMPIEIRLKESSLSLFAIFWTYLWKSMLNLPVLSQSMKCVQVRATVNYFSLSTKEQSKLTAAIKVWTPHVFLFIICRFRQENS